MNILASMVSQVVSQETPEQQIISVLENAFPALLSSAEIYQAMPQPPDRETVTRTIQLLTKSGKIRRGEDGEGNGNFGRKTAARYTLPDQTAVTQKNASRKEVIQFLSEQAIPVPSQHIVNHLNVTSKSVANVLFQLQELGTVGRVGQGKPYRYFLVKKQEEAEAVNIEPAEVSVLTQQPVSESVPDLVSEAIPSPELKPFFTRQPQRGEMSIGLELLHLEDMCHRHIALATYQVPARLKARYAEHLIKLAAQMLKEECGRNHTAAYLYGSATYLD